MALNTGWSGSPALKKRFIIASLAALAVFVFLFLRLWYLQIIQADIYQALSEKNRTRYIPIAAPRGPIVDRDGHMLVDNRPAFRITALRQEVEEPEKMLTRLAELLALDLEILQERWAAGRRFPRYRPVPLADDVSRQALERVMEHSYELPGILTEVRPVRFYPHGESAAHLFGYLGEITEEELRAAPYQAYHPGDFVGKNGLERGIEQYLTGIPGERRVEVDVKGKKLRILKTQEPVPGNRVTLTINRDLQLATEEAFGDQAGAAVALDINTGEVLAMVSTPCYDPSLFARGITGKEWVELLHNPLDPLQNRALKGQYPPGSIFKIVTALAALESGKATARTKVDCQGALTVGNRSFRCWKKGGHGVTDLKKALKESCDVWFYEVSQQVGIDRIADMARRLGLGEPTGLGLAGERQGLIPDQQWKQQKFNDRWYRGETLIASIGQGYILTTPLQLATMMATVANGGTVLRPYLVKHIEDMAGETQQQTQPQIVRKAHLNKSQLDALRRGLEAVVNEPHGTAWMSRIKELPYAGKTGTSQVVHQRKRREKDAEIPYRLRDHALFSAYAPAANPQIAVAVVVEHGSHGSSAAAPIAKAMFDSYFKLQSPTESGAAEEN
ncbi:penicillin-binding protein 2 [Syntrophotalea acetylenivorans]|uniref:Penicillin-binding protein 2 n=1 Tax=Syntrophotalea acetylenivorans TaxID=1842532 RepID=A0A1L3GN91_9BACT|nr:penicillin-binding protein 2 [Syntrophotalea acetylenivorans]APG27407.1 penicillin-binding protein 2 [Syntrophotalea acetylenivorans]